MRVHGHSWGYDRRQTLVQYWTFLAVTVGWRVGRAVTVKWVAWAVQQEAGVKSELAL